MSQKIKKSELGKGLRALLGDTQISTSSNIHSPDIASPDINSVQEISIDWIETNPFQPRHDFDPTELQELADSIKVHGIIQPLTVRKLSVGKYQLISGERRWRASRMAGLVTVPVYVREANDQGMLEMALIENIQRQDLNPIEIGISYQRLLDEIQLTHEELAQRVGKNRSTITNFTRLLKLPPEIQQQLKSGTLTMGHAKAILSVPDIILQLTIAKDIIQNNLSVRASEALVQKLQNNSKKPSITNVQSQSDINPEVRVIQDRLSRSLGTIVKVQIQKNGSGNITIPFQTTDQLDQIVDIIEE